MKRTILLVGLLVALLAPHAAYGQAWSTFLDSSRATDWTTVGFTIPSYSTNCSAQPSLTAGAGSASANATSIHNALVSCDATHNVVNIPSGTYFVTSTSFGTQGKQVLRGAGANLTTLIYTTGVGCGGGLTSAMCLKDAVGDYNGSTDTQPGGVRACSGWTGGLTQGSTSLTLTGCGAAPPNGQSIILDQANDVTDTGGVYICDVNIADCGYESSTGGNNDGRFISGKTHSQQQVTLVTGVVSLGGGSYTVTISPGVYFSNVRTGLAAGAWWPGFVQLDGVENMTIDTSNANFSGGTAVSMYDCWNCWVKGVRSIDAGRNHVMFYQSGFDVVRDSYFYQSQSHSSQSYVIEQSEASGYLVENNIFQQVTAPIISGQGSGGVIDYNFSIGNIYTGATNWMNPSYSSHNAGNEMDLYEGNILNGLSADDAWGASTQQTYFRNQLVGWQATLVSNTEPVVMRANVRAMNMVGNILGQPSYHNQYQTIATSTTGGTGTTNVFTSIYDLGWGGISICATGSITHCDPKTVSTLMRWGNYDVVTAGNKFDSTEASPAAVAFVNANFSSSYFGSLSHTLPASLVYSSTPSWWPAGKAWPPIGPDISTGNVGICAAGSMSQSAATASSQCPSSSVTTAWASHVNSNPAMDCYLSNMSGPPDGTGSVLTFNPATCYVISSTVATPTFSPNTGTYSGTQSVTISTSTGGGATLCYTTDGSTPTANGAGTCTHGTTYSTAVSVAASLNLQAIGSLSGSSDSAVGSATYTITAPGSPAVGVSPTSVNFGNSAVAATSTSQTVTITNTGTAALVFSGNATMSAANPGDFTVSASSTCKSGVSVAPNGTCTIVMTFTPSAQGARTATVSISDNASGSPHSAGLTGTGVASSTAPITINCPTTSKCTIVGQITMSQGPPVAITPASVSISPMTGSVLINGTFPIVANVTNDPAFLGVTWTVTGPTCSGAACGTISPSTSASGATVTYTAPPSSPGSVFITASAVANQSSAQTNITVVNPVPPPSGPTGVNVFTPSCAKVTITTTITTCSFTGYAGPTMVVNLSSVTTSSTVTGVQACKSGLSCSALTLTASIDLSGAKKTYQFRGINIGAGFNQVVVTASDPNALNVSIFDTANVGAFDTSATKTGTATTNPTGPSVTTATANELVVCALGTNGTASAIAAPFVFDSVGKDGAAGAINPTASAISPSWTTTNATYAALCGAYSVGTSPPAITVVNNPLSINVQSSATQVFRATVGNDAAGSGVDWTCTSGGGTCGTFSPTHTASGAATTWTAPALVPPGAAVTLLQHPNNLTQTNPATFPISASTAGSALCVYDAWNTATGTMTVADSKGETWGAAIDTVGSVAGRSAAIDCLPNNVGGVGSITVTVTGASPTSHEWFVREYSGALTSSIVDQFTHATGSVSPMDSGFTSATTNATDILLGCGLNGAASTFTVGNDGQGDTYGNLDKQTFLGTACEDFFTTSATNTYKATLTPDAASSSAMFVVALKAGTGSGTGNANITVTATSTADNTKAAVSTVTLTAATPPISVVVNPQSGTLTAGTGTISITPTVSNDSGAAGVTWTLNGLGSISLTSSASNTPTVYTPPASVSTANNAVITATSVTDTTKSASASILVNPVTGGGGGTGGTTATCPGGTCPAFAGALGTAQGGGAASLGGSGRSGTGPPQVFLVKNCNDSGADSLRAAAQAVGARFAIFRISCHNAQQSRIQVSNPYLYVAGQTVPGGGYVQGGIGSSGQAFFISTHDVTIRYMTYDGATSSISGSTCNNTTGSVGLELGSGNVFNVMLDHQTHRDWGNKDFELVSNGVGQNVHDITIQNSMGYEPCNDHPVLTEPDVFAGGSQFASVNQDWHHNFFSNGNHRYPLCAIRSLRWVNNIIYNTLSQSDDFNWSCWGAVQADIIGNKYVDGPQSSFHVFNFVDQADPTDPVDKADCAFSTPGCDNGPAQGRYPGYYFQNNVGHAGTNTGSAPIAFTHAVNDAGQLSMFAAVTNAEGAKNPTTPPGASNPNSCGGPSVTCWFRNAPLAAETFPITADPAENLDAVLLSTVGNSGHLDCQGNLVGNRDSQDARVIQQYQNKGPGGAWEGPDYTGPHFPGAPAIPAGTLCPMSLNDGIYDGWKQKYGLSLTDATLWQKTDPKSGFLILEDFLDGIIPTAP